MHKMSDLSHFLFNFVYMIVVIFKFYWRIKKIIDLDLLLKLKNIWKINLFLSQTDNKNFSFINFKLYINRILLCGKFKIILKLKNDIMI